MKGSKTGKQGCCVVIAARPSARPQTQDNHRSQPDLTHPGMFAATGQGRSWGFRALQALQQVTNLISAAGELNRGNNSGKGGRRPARSPSNKVPRGVARSRLEGGRRPDLQKALQDIPSGPRVCARAPRPS